MPAHRTRQVGWLLTTFALLAPIALTGQAVVLDEGRFAVFVEGREVGSESFTIQRGGSGADARILSTAVIQLESDGGVVEMRPMLDASTDLVARVFENKISGSRAAQVNGFVNGGRFVSRVTSEDGEMQREYRFGAGAVLLEEDVAHLYYFISSRATTPGSTLSAIVPSTGQQLRLSVVSSEVEPFRLGREQLDARHVRLEGADVRHDVWLDDQGRVLRVEVPERGYRAERISN